MAELHVITALVEKYRVISGQKVTCETQVAQYQSQLDTISAAIKLFKPDYDLRTIESKRPIKFVFRRNHFMRCAMGILRETKEPLSAKDITLQTFAKLGAEPDDPNMDRFTKYLANSLIAKEREGIVTGDSDYPRRWEIKR